MIIICPNRVFPGPLNGICAIIPTPSRSTNRMTACIDTPVIIVDVNNFEKIKPIVGDNYYRHGFHPHGLAESGLFRVDLAAHSERHHQSGLAIRHLSNLAQSGLFGLCQSNRQERPDLIRLAAIRQNAIIYPQRYCCTNMGIWDLPGQRQSKPTHMKRELLSCRQIWFSEPMIS